MSTFAESATRGTATGKPTPLTTVTAIVTITHVGAGGDGGDDAQ